MSNPGVCLRIRGQHSQFWQILTRFVDYYSPIWDPEAISIGFEPQGVLTCWTSTLVVLGRFWPVSWTITHRFGVPKHFPLLLNPKVCLRVGHQHQEFWPILARFMDYYSPFFGSKAISMVVELQGALTCRSSTITVWADFGPFPGLLLSFRVPRSFP